jgi:hypothetical protein
MRKETSMRTLGGQLRVEERKKGRVWVAKYDLASGKPTRKTLGPAWVKASGRRTARGAVVCAPPTLEA